MSMITAAQWVPRGFAAQFPQKYTLNEAEYQRIADLAKLQLDDAQDDLQEARNGGDENDDAGAVLMKENGEATKVPDGDQASPVDEDVLKEYDLEHYDDDNEHDGAHTDGQGMSIFGNIKSLAYYESNEEDPYITLGGNDDEQDEEREDLQILPSDNLILSAKVEDEMAHLEVYVYEDEGDNLYVHHDIMLPAIPLCLEWLDVPLKSQDLDGDRPGNFVAVGTMDPDIEVWNLDTIDCMYPDAILGRVGDAEAAEKKGTKKGAKKKSNRANDEYHVDAVLSLAANRSHRNLLASASADQTIKLWDLKTTKCAKSYSHHTDKVCSLEWHMTEATVLLSGSYDRTAVAADMRAPGAKAPRWGVDSDVENVRWNVHDGNYFFVTTERGTVYCYDVRNAPSQPASSKPVWTLQAHDASVSSFDVNPVVPGFLATGSTDKTVKLWHVAAAGPSMITTRNMDVGKVFATKFAPDGEVAFRLAVAGSSGSVHVWDTSSNRGVRAAFKERVPARVGEEVADRLVAIRDDESSSSDEEEGEEGEEIPNAAGEHGEGDYG